MAFRADYDGIGRLLTSSAMQVEMGRRARRVAARARSIAPVGPEDDPHRGAYRASIDSSVGVQQRRTRRAVGIVTADVPYAVEVEYGTTNTPKHRTLGKALDAARD